MKQKIIITELLHNVIEINHKVCQVLRNESCITKYDSMLLQRASGITKCDSYYKMRLNRGGD